MSEAFDSGALRMINEPLLAWYRGHARELPWREKDGRAAAYRVWVSEIMLQQTRVEAVRPYYARFMEALPTIRDLAECPEEQLLKLWEGLGYYSRVRNMQRCARELLAERDGHFPMDEKALLALPGIGPYTAGAIASIAFGLPVPAVDGNVLRVISRVAGSREDILLPRTRKQVEAALRESLPKDEAGAFNQALMDLGAMVCLPGTQARCKAGDCPLFGLCESGRRGLAGEIPVRNPKIRKRQENRTVLVIRDGRRTVLRKRGSRGLLAGLYEPPCMEGEAGTGEVLAFLEKHGLSPLRIRPLPPAKHLFTHLAWRMTGFDILVEDLSESGLPVCGLPGVSKETATGLPADPAMTEEAGPWFAVEAVRIGEAYAIPSAYRAYVRYMAGRGASGL